MYLSLGTLSGHRRLDAIQSVFLQKGNTEQSQHTELISGVIAEGIQQAIPVTIQLSKYAYH